LFRPGERDACEGQVRSVGEELVSPIVVEHAELAAVSERGDEEIDGREWMVAGPSELARSDERAPFDRLVDHETAR
jgi:hypothetical protein